MDDDVLGSGMQHTGGTRLAFLRTEPRTQEERTPRPKTAPNASSPSLSPSGSITSQMTVMPRDFGLDSGDTEPRRTQTAPTSEDDVLFAFSKHRRGGCAGPSCIVARRRGQRRR